MKYEIDVATTEKKWTLMFLILICERDGYVKKRKIDSKGLTYKSSSWRYANVHLVKWNILPTLKTLEVLEEVPSSPKGNLSVGVTGFDVTKKLCLDSSGKIVKYVIHCSPK